MTQGSPEPADERYVESRLTHSGAVIMVGERAYKLKRPLRLGFLDFTDVARRREICLKELSLNRRLAPDIYLGLGSIEDPVSGAEPVVVMRRLPAARRLARLVTRGVTVDDDLRRLARQLAVFHTHAVRGPEIDAEGTRDAIRQRWTDSFDQVRGDGSMLDPAVTQEIERLTVRFLGVETRCSRHGSPLDAWWTATATSWPRTSSASTTARASSTAWSSTTGCATWTRSTTCAAW